MARALPAARSILAWLGAGAMALIVGEAATDGYRIAVTPAFQKAFELSWFLEWVGVLAISGLVFCPLPSLLGVLIIRRLRWPRPWADIGMALVILYVGATVLFLWACVVGPLVRGESGADVRDGFAQAFEMCAKAGEVLIPAGLAGGLSYWLFAGRPRPPYGARDA